MDREMKSTLFMVNIVLTTRVKRLQEELEELQDNLKRYKTHGPNKIHPFDPKFKAETPKRKRKRKKKNEVERNYSCHIDNCQKSYGSENSLNQHMKIKHPEFWLRIKEKEQNLTTINTYSVKESVFPNPRIVVTDVLMGNKRDFQQFEKSRTEKNESHISSLNMSLNLKSQRKNLKKNIEPERMTRMKARKIITNMTINNMNENTETIPVNNSKSDIPKSNENNNDRETISLNGRPTIEEVIDSETEQRDKRQMESRKNLQVKKVTDVETEGFADDQNVKESEMLETLLNK